MKINQLSVFLENKPGHLAMACEALGEAGIDIKAMSLADTQQFGILRLIVPEWEKAKTILEQGGCVTNVTEVIAIAVPDEPGGLAGVLQSIENEKINVEYMYAFSNKYEGDAVLIFRFSDVDAAVKSLEGKGVKVLASKQIMPG